MKQIRDMWGKGGKAYKAALVLGYICVSAWFIYVIVKVWEGLIILAVVLISTLVAGLAYWILLGIGWAVVYGAIKGAINEVKNFLKEMKG